MHGNLNAAGILLTMVLTAVVIKFGQKKTNIKRMVFAAFVTILVSLLLRVFSSHKCPEGQPFTQWLIPGICLFLIIGFIANKIIRRIIAVVTIIISTILCFHFSEIVHRKDYTGNVLYREAAGYWKLRTYQRILKLAVEEKLAKKEKLKIFPPGWIKHSLKDIDIEIDWKNDIKVPICTSAWHTFFTGIYCISEYKNMGIWYPGGTVKEAADKLELRERKPANEPEEPN